MKTKISILITILVLSLITNNELKAQTTLPYFTGFDNAAQKSGWQIFRTGATGTYLWNYTISEPYSGTESIYHDYPVGGTAVTDDWFVSPAFNLTGGGKLDSIRYSFSGFGMPTVDDTLAIYLIKGNADPALATSKVLLYDYRDVRYINDNTWHLNAPINIPATSGTCFIAIRYKTINNWLTVKFDNFRLSGNAVTGIAETNKHAATIEIYPNPVNDFLTIRSNEKIKEIMVTDLNGRVVSKQMASGKIDVSLLGKGLCNVSCITLSGNRINKSFIKN
jgi:hypothetical protein